MLERVINVPIFGGKVSIVIILLLEENMKPTMMMEMGDIHVSAQDELKGILHPYQKLKGFYKEVLNLGSEYVKNEKVGEWITHGHVSIYEME
ncbi:hypothetical protein Tco_0800788 [Tanacetum coccineum]|uniref:Uncharacterized protein n=1 Tax=Tanacetum coccineum TaxID=301880 RepID=A0ABQ4ZXX8_9ASTR